MMVASQAHAESAHGIAFLATFVHADTLGFELHSGLCPAEVLRDVCDAFPVQVALNIGFILFCPTWLFLPGQAQVISPFPDHMPRVAWKVVHQFVYRFRGAIVLCENEPATLLIQDILLWAASAMNACALYANLLYGHEWLYHYALTSKF